jgi:hypothetical protein
MCSSNKILIYKVATKPIWTYGIQLGGTAFYLKNYGTLLI